MMPTYLPPPGLPPQQFPGAPHPVPNNSPPPADVKVKA